MVWLVCVAVLAADLGGVPAAGGGPEAWATESSAEPAHQVAPAFTALGRTDVATPPWDAEVWRDAVAGGVGVGRAVDKRGLDVAYGAIGLDVAAERAWAAVLDVDAWSVHAGAVTERIRGAGCAPSGVRLSVLTDVRRFWISVLKEPEEPLPNGVRALGWYSMDRWGPGTYSDAGWKVMQNSAFLSNHGGLLVAEVAPGKSVVGYWVFVDGSDPQGERLLATVPDVLSGLREVAASAGTCVDAEGPG